jgi:hypothetical protein
MAFAGLAICLRLEFPMRIFAMTYLWRTHEASSHAHIMRVVQFIHGDATALAGVPKTVAIKSKTGQRDLSQCPTTLA